MSHFDCQQKGETAMGDSSYPGTVQQLREALPRYVSDWAREVASEAIDDMEDESGEARAYYLARWFDAMRAPAQAVPDYFEVAGKLGAALVQIAGMDPKECRADDLGRAARIAREALAPALSSTRRVGGISLDEPTPPVVTMTDRVTLPGHDETMANLNALTISSTDETGAA